MDDTLEDGLENELEQWAGLEDRSRAPRRQAEAVSDEIEARVLALK